MASLTNGEINDEFNNSKRSNFRHPHRRYILEMPNYSTTIKKPINNEQQTKLNNNSLGRQSNPSNYSKNENKFHSHQNINHSKYNNNKEQDLNKDLYSNHKYEIKLSKNKHEYIDDPWVKQILQTDLDLSTLDQQEPQIQIVNINHYKTNNSNSISQYYSHDENNNQDNFQTKILDPSQFPSIIKDKNRKTNLNSSRKWILQQPTYSPINSNSISLNKNIHLQYKDKFNSRKTNIDEEKSLLKQENKSIHSKHHIRNNK
ncbi:unnamed protein product, partial [Rotaria sp. Silwood2]